MSIISDHTARFGLPPEVIHAMLAEIEEQYEAGATDLDIAVQVAATVPGSPYAVQQVISDVTDLLDAEYDAARS